jgi:hypothetical protein
MGKEGIVHLRNSCHLGFSLRGAVSEERFRHVVLDILIWRELLCNCFLRNPNERNVHVSFEVRSVKGRER